MKLEKRRRQVLRFKKYSLMTEETHFRVRRSLATSSRVRNVGQWLGAD